MTIKIPCLLCSQELVQRKDKNQKPYFICNPCGVQIFVRGHQGIENLAQLVEQLQQREFPFREHARILYQIQAVLSEIRGLEKEVKSLEQGVLDVFFGDEYKERARRALKARIEALLAELEQLANGVVKG